MHDLSKIKNSGLHDYEIKDINIDYITAFIKLSFESEKNEIYEIRIEHFVSFEISHKEEWGKGKYVCSSEIKFDVNQKLYLVEIELNSGDTIIIQYQ